MICLQELELVFRHTYGWTAPLYFGTEFFGTEYFGTEYFGTEYFGTEYFGNWTFGTEYFGTWTLGTEYFGTECKLALKSNYSSNSYLFKYIFF